MQDVIALHDEETSAPVHDLGILDSAVAQPGQTAFGEYAYPTLIEQAAALLRGLAQTQAFQDGNKRTAWLATVTFLDVNGVELSPVALDEAERFVLEVASAHLTVQVIARWLSEHI